MLGDVLQPLLEHRDLAANDAAVGLELRFAGAAEPDAAADTRQVRPHAGQARQQVLELRQFDLQLRLVAARARGEDVENHLGAIHHAHAEALLELDALHRRQALVEQQQGGAARRQLVFQRFNLALAEVEVGSGCIDALDGSPDDLGAGGIRESLEFPQVLIHMHRIVGTLTGSSNEIGTLDWSLDFYKLTDKSS